MRVTDDLLRTALLAALPEPAELPPGEHEVRCGCEGVASEFHSCFGLHGRLVVRRNRRPLGELLENAVALLLAKVPARDRAAMIERLAASSAVADTGSLPQTKAARRVLRALRRRAGVEWKDTPGYKPRA